MTEQVEVETIAVSMVSSFRFLLFSLSSLARTGQGRLSSRAADSEGQ